MKLVRIQRCVLTKNCALIWMHSNAKMKKRSPWSKKEPTENYSFRLSSSSSYYARLGVRQNMPFYTRYFFFLCGPGKELEQLCMSGQAKLKSFFRDIGGKKITSGRVLFIPKQHKVYIKKVTKVFSNSISLGKSEKKEAREIWTLFDLRVAFHTARKEFLDPPQEATAKKGIPENSMTAKPRKGHKGEAVEATEFRFSGFFSCGKMCFDVAAHFASLLRRESLIQAGAYLHFPESKK